MPPDAAPALLYLPALPAAGEELALPDDEARYLTRVCRAAAGERVSATDGRGALARLVVLAVRGAVTAQVETVERVERARRSWVWCGAPEGDRGDWLVEKLGELGVERFQPVDFERGAWRRAAGRRERWRRLAVAALRQSRRRFLMEVEEPLPLAVAVGGRPPGASCWLAVVGGHPVAGTPPPAAGLAVGVIGPAGGLSEGEKRALESSNFQAISLADARLRTETAAMAWAAWWAAGGG